MSIASHLKAPWEKIRDENLLVLNQIWSNSYPLGAPKVHTPVEKILFTPPLLGRCLSLSNLAAAFGLSGHMMWTGFIDYYVMCWVVALSILLFGSWWQTLGWIAVVVASYSVVEILSTNLCVLLVDSQRPSWRAASFRRSLLLALLGFYSIVAAYAIIYLVAGGIVENKPAGDLLGSPMSAFYFSLVTMATLGYGEFVPADDFSRGIVIFQLFSELLLLLAIIPAFASNVIGQLAGREEITRTT